MSLPPRFAATVMSATASSARKHSLEFYLDYMCPWCAKMFGTLDNSIMSILKESYPDKVDVIIRPQCQPWDHSSAFATETVMVVNALAPGDSELFWKFTKGFMEHREEFLEVKIAKETQNETYKRLADLVENITGIKADQVYERLEVGNPARKQTVLDFKRVTRAARKVGNHMTPTVYLDGLEATGIDSGYTPDQWKEWLKNNIA